MLIAVDTKGASIDGTALITALPVVSMILGSSAVFFMGMPSERLQARLQLLSGGLLIGAVVTDIFPMLKSHIILHDDDERRVSLAGCLSALVGFASALVLMYGIKSLDLGGDDGELVEDESNKEASPLPTASPHTALLTGSREKWDAVGCPNASEAARLRMAVNRLAAHSTNLMELVVVGEEVDREAVDEAVHGLDFLIDSTRRLLRGVNPIDQHNAGRLRHHIGELDQSIKALQQVDPSRIPQIDKLLRSIAETLRHVHSHAERGTFRRWVPRRPVLENKVSMEEASSASKVFPKFPVSLMLAVVVDAVVDGMLIGLASSVASKSGQLMAIATAIEMGFLGYSFACSMIGTARRFTVVGALMVPPLTMFCASIFASWGTDYLETSPAFVGLIAFAMVALLFLVLQELLLEAHEKDGGDEWHITVWIYIGLFMSMVFEVML